MFRTPFQEWFESTLQARGWSLREAARRLGVTGSTPFHYRSGTMLPTVAMQRRLAELTGMPVKRLAQLVWDSKGTQPARKPRASPVRPADSTPRGPRRRRWRWRSRPLGVMFTMYRTGSVREEHLDRLHELATARRTGIEAVLDEALSIALPIMAQGSARRRPRP